MVMTRSQHQYNSIDDSMEGLIIDLSSKLNILISNHPELDLQDLVCTIKLILKNIDNLNSKSVTQNDALEASFSEIQTLTSKLEVEKELRAKEVTNSFKLQDEVNEEVVNLENKISNLEQRLQEYVLQCRDAETATNSALSN